MELKMQFGISKNKLSTDESCLELMPFRLGCSPVESHKGCLGLEISNSALKR